MIELFKAIQERFDNSTDFSTALTGGFHYGEAPNDCGSPYAVFSSYGSTPDDTFADEIGDIPVQINIYSEKSKAVECFDLLKSCNALFSGAVLVVENHENVRLTKEMEQPPFRSNDKWMAVLELSCLLQQI